jgi:hypothetical protein
MLCVTFTLILKGAMQSEKGTPCAAGAPCALIRLSYGWQRSITSGLESFAASGLWTLCL